MSSIWLRKFLQNPHTAFPLTVWCVYFNIQSLASDGRPIPSLAFSGPEPPRAVRFSLRIFEMSCRSSAMDTERPVAPDTRMKVCRCSVAPFPLWHHSVLGVAIFGDRWRTPTPFVVTFLMQPIPSKCLGTGLILGFGERPGIGVQSCMCNAQTGRINRPTTYKLNKVQKVQGTIHEVHSP